MKIELRSPYRYLLSLLTTAFLLVCGGAANAVTPMVAAGGSHSVALGIDGKVYGWGNDSDGQLGLGRAVQTVIPQAVVGLNLGPGSGKSRVVSGWGQNVSLRSDGTVWAWGVGYLGDGAESNHSTPIQVPGLRDVIAVAGGDQHSVILKSDGTVWAWGSNVAGQLGDGTMTDRVSPALVQGLTGVVSIAAGQWGHTLVAKADGSVWAWGPNSEGQLGDGTTENRLTPVQVIGLSGVTEVGAGEAHSMAVKSDGTVWTWGRNSSGQLGDGTNTERHTPQKVTSLSDVKYCVGGDSHTLALTTNGTLWAWGSNGNNQLGDGTYGNRLSPVRVDGLDGVIAISATSHNMALKSDGTVWTWGYNFWGQIGNGTTGYASPIVQVPGLYGAVAVEAGEFHSVAIKADGSVWAWGANFMSQLGDGASALHSVPEQVPTLNDVMALAAGEQHSIALKSDGTVWGWGWNYYSQLGESPDVPNRSTPVMVPGLNGVAGIAAGAQHNIAVKSDGTVWTWGYGGYGQLGSLQNDVSRYIPNAEGKALGQVQGLGNVRAVAAGERHSLALKSDGTVWGWGGCYAWGCESLPTQVSGLGAVVAIAAAGNQSIALRSDGTVWRWAMNGAPTLPTLEAGLSEIVAISIGDYSATNRAIYGKRLDGSVWVNGSRVSAFANLGFMSVSQGHTLAVLLDGRVLTWGSNDYGQLGDGTFSQRSNPALAIRSAVDGFLNLTGNSSIKVPSSQNVPFFIKVKSTALAERPTVSVNLKPSASDTGKSGSVFVTAVVPPGTLGNAPVAVNSPKHVLSATPQEVAAASTCPVTTNPLSLIQLTPTGWQTVVNGQLIPYASGVLGDQLAAQTILNGTDTSNLKGAEFCVGYGTSAEDMVNNGNIRAVATIPGATSTSTCVVGSTISVGLNLTPGWNLLGNPINQSIAVVSKFGDASKVNSVWKWDTTKANWQFYAPGLDAAALQNYVTSQGYGILTEISPGDGYWVHAKVQADLGSMCGSSINLRQSSLSSGWNLVSTASPISAKEFNLTLSTTPPTAGQVPINMTSLWAWDANQANWYFYAPSLEAQGGSVLTEYIQNKNYRDFTTSGKTLGNGVGIWVNRP